MVSFRQPASELLKQLRQLRDLKKTPKPNGVINIDPTDVVKNCLEAAFQELKRAGITIKGTEDIASLIVDDISYIDAAVFYIGLNFDVDDGPQNLILRSGLQFILDNFGTIRDENGQEFDLKEKLASSIETFDRGIQYWKECSVVTDEDVAHSYEDLRRPKGVPEGHWWWWE